MVVLYFILYCIVLYCIVLHCIVFFFVLYFIVLYCIILYCIGFNFSGLYCANYEYQCVIMQSYFIPADQKLKAAIAKGLPTLVAHLERGINGSFLDALLTKSIRIADDGTQFILHGKHRFDYHTNFRLYLSANVSMDYNKKYRFALPLHRTFVVNMTTGREGLEAMLTSFTVHSEKPELENQKRSLDLDLFYLKKEKEKIQVYIFFFFNVWEFIKWQELIKYTKGNPLFLGLANLAKHKFASFTEDFLLVQFTIWKAKVDFKAVHFQQVIFGVLS